MALNKRILFKKRQLRVRNKLKKHSGGKLRLSVHRSCKNLYVQIIDDSKGHTVASTSTLDKKLGLIGKNNIETASKIGADIAKKAEKAGVKEVYFDRGGLLFHGKIKALAESARSAGLKFWKGKWMVKEDNRRDKKKEESSEFSDRLVAINRVSKTVKGGKRFGFAALVVVGDQKGRVGYGKGKAKEVPEAIRKATEQAKRKIIKVPLKEGRTLHHDIDGRHGAGKVVLRTAPPGTGIIAGGPMRAVFEMLGVQDVVSKSTGSPNPYNMIRATIAGLLKETSPRIVAQRRGKKMSEIFVKNTNNTENKNLT